MHENVLSDRQDCSQSASSLIGLCLHFQKRFFRKTNFGFLAKQVHPKKAEKNQDETDNRQKSGTGLLDKEQLFVVRQSKGKKLPQNIRSAVLKCLLKKEELGFVQLRPGAQSAKKRQPEKPSGFSKGKKQRQQKSRQTQKSQNNEYWKYFFRNQLIVPPGSAAHRNTLFVCMSSLCGHTE